MISTPQIAGHKDAPFPGEGAHRGRVLKWAHTLQDEQLFREEGRLCNPICCLCTGSQENGVDDCCFPCVCGGAEPRPWGSSPLVSMRIVRPALQASEVFLWASR